LKVIKAIIIISLFLLPIPSPTTLRRNIPLVLFRRILPLGGDSPLWNMGARQRHLRLARGSADSDCLRTRYYPHHAPPRPHTRFRTLTTPLHATTLHSHLLPAHTPAPHSYLCFGYKQPVPSALLGFVSAAAKTCDDRATPNIHSTHSINICRHPNPTPLGKVSKRALVVPPSSPHRRVFACGACTDTAQIGRSVVLVSLFDPHFKRFGLNCLDVCLSDICDTCKYDDDTYTASVQVCYHTDLLWGYAVPVLLKYDDDVSTIPPNPVRESIWSRF